MTADPNDTFLDLVRRAQANDRGAVEILAELVRPRVYAFIRRLLLDAHTAEDLTQETALSVVSSIGTLRKPEQFWSWVFSIAYSQMRQHLRRRFRRGAECMLDGSRADVLQTAGGGFTDASQRELAELTRQAMAQLAVRHRTVLALRVFEEMPHAEVAKVLGCSELSARVAFFHAKREMKRRLHRLGVDHSMLAAALTAFGIATLSSTAPAATVTVSMSAVTEGMMASLLSTKAKVACVTVVLVGAWVSWGLLTGRPARSTGRWNPPTETAVVADVPEIAPDGSQMVFV